MSNIPGWLSRLVTARPYITILVIVIITVLLAAGATRRAPPPETASTFPQNNAVADALADIDEHFGDSGETSVVTLLFRGEALTPQGLSQMDALINDMVSDPGVGELLAPGNPIVAPSFLVRALLQLDSLESVTQAEIDSAQGPPRAMGRVDALTGTDTDGTPVAIATIRLFDTGDERVEAAERRINGSQVHASAPMHPAICLRPTQDDHGLCKRRADFKYRAVLLREVRK